MFQQTLSGLRCSEEEVGTAIENFVSLPHFLTIFPFRIFPCQEALIVLKLVMPAFGQGKFVRVYDCQAERKLDKCTRNTFMVLANKRRPADTSGGPGQTIMY